MGAILCTASYIYQYQTPPCSRESPLATFKDNLGQQERLSMKVWTNIALVHSPRHKQLLSQLRSLRRDPLGPTVASSAIPPTGSGPLWLGLEGDGSSGGSSGSPLLLLLTRWLQVIASLPLIGSLAAVSRPEGRLSEHEYIHECLLKDSAASLAKDDLSWLEEVHVWLSQLSPDFAGHFDMNGLDTWVCQPVSSVFSGFLPDI